MMFSTVVVLGLTPKYILVFWVLKYTNRKPGMRFLCILAEFHPICWPVDPNGGRESTPGRSLPCTPERAGVEHGGRGRKELTNDMEMVYPHMCWSVVELKLCRT